jgi:hypothetical protein
VTVPHGFFEGLAIVGTGTGLAYIDKTGQVILKTPYSDAHQFSEGLAPVEINEKWGFIDKNGKIVIEPRFLNAESFSEGLAAVGVMAAKKGDTPVEIRVGYINKAGQMVVAPRFSFALGFSEGLAPVIIGGRLVRTTKEHTGLRFVGGRWAFVDKSGRVVFRLEPKTDYAGGFKNGLGYVRLKDLREGYVDRTGKYIWMPTK